VNIEKSSLAERLSANLHVLAIVALLVFAGNIVARSGESRRDPAPPPAASAPRACMPPAIVAAEVLAGVAPGKSPVR
jgi:hypothetical protein